MLIKRTSVTITYKKIEGIKKKYIDNDGILREYFNEAAILPIPDNAPDEIPRIMIKTLNEHAQLNISPIATTLEVKYDSGYERDWDKCSEYLTERMTSVFELLDILTDGEYGYAGLVSEVLYDKVQRDGAKKISESLLNAKNIKNIYDINIKYTFVEKAKIFTNIMLQNARILNENGNMGKAGWLSECKQVAESIAAIIDINDRHGFNTDKNYKSNSNTLKELIEIMGKNINEKIELLIEKGEY